MAAQSTTNPSDVANRLRTYFSKKLLEHIQYSLVFDQWATKDVPIPANWGAKTIRFSKRRPAKTGQVSTLVEGTAISTFTEINIGYVDATLVQVGEATRVTDVLNVIDLFPIFQQSIQAMGEDAALDYDTRIQTAIVAGMLNSNTTYGTGFFERFASIKNTGTSSTDFTSLVGASPANAKFTRLQALSCITQLKKNRVPKLSGGYVCPIPPQILHDARQDTDWVTAATRVNAGKALYKDEVIELDGVRYVEHNNPWIEKQTYGTADSTGGIYSAFFIGRQAYGVPDIPKLGNGMKPHIIIVNTPDSANPLNQFITAGWKAFYKAVLLLTNEALDVPHLVQLRCQTTHDA